MKKVIIGVLLSVVAASCGSDAETKTRDEVIVEKISVVNKELVVKANGSRIGYLQMVNTETLLIWDDVNNLLFSVNDTTAHVTSPSLKVFTSDDCSGEIYEYHSRGDCSGAFGEPPARRYAGGLRNDNLGWGRPHRIMTTAGTYMRIDAQSSMTSGSCARVPYGETCVLEAVDTDIIPTVYARPITIEDEE